MTLVSLVGYSTMAGTVGGGDLGIRYGYQRFMPEVILIAVNHRLARRREGR